MGRVKQANPSRVLKASAGGKARGKTTLIEGVEKKKRKSPKFSQRVTIGRKMRAEQKRSHELGIPKAPMSRLVHEVTGECLRIEDPRLTATAVKAIQEAAEAYLVRIFQATAAITANDKRQEIMVRDMRLAQMLMTPGALDRDLAERNHTLMLPRPAPVHAVDTIANGEEEEEEE